MVQLRHDKAVRIIAKAVSKGQRGGNLVLVDAGAAARAAEEGCCFANRDRKRWDQVLTQLKIEECGSRPDMILFDDKEILLCEIKYCPDTRLQDQLKHAQDQHGQMTTTLAQKWPSRKVQVIPIMLGIGGTTYMEHTQQVLTRLGVAHDKSLKCCRKLTRHALASGTQISSTAYMLRGQHRATQPQQAG